MAVVIIVVLTGVLTVVPVLAYQRWERRSASRSPQPVTLGPVSGADFWPVDQHITRGTRAPDSRTRALIRAEITWRRRTQHPPVTDQTPWWARRVVAFVVISAVTIIEAATHHWENAVFNVLFTVLLVKIRRDVRGEQHRLDTAEELNRD